jgi:Mrp family chromosome partitioning ATPase
MAAQDQAVESVGTEVSTVTPEHFPRRGEIITFYSYKGGTGRTMALSNVACVLAGEGKSVLMIDWDLEAPGLCRYFSKSFQSAFSGHPNPKALDLHPGLIELFDELDKRIPTEPSVDLDEDGEIVSQVLDRVVSDQYLGRFILKSDVPNLSLLKSGSSDEEYSRRVNRFNWESLFHRSPFLIRSLIERLALSYDYVLVDSRTGMTDTSGICTMLLPEKLVIVFTPNTQSLTGVKELIQRATRYRRGSDDLRPLSIFPLPSRVESSREDLRNAWRFGDSGLGIEGYQEMFQDLLKEEYDLENCSLTDYFNEVQIQQSADYAYGEEIAVLVEQRADRLSLARSYRTFTERLVASQGPWAEQRQASDSAAICYSVLPYAPKLDNLPGRVDFDAVYTQIVMPAVVDAGLQSIRSDAGMAGDIVSQPQLELLTAAQFAVVDVTGANSSVIYQLGVRHALRPGSTVILCSAESGSPFEPGAMPCFSYQMKDSGTLANAPKVKAELLAWLKKARVEPSVDSPVFHLLDLKPAELPGLAEDVPARAKHVEAARERLAKTTTQGLAALRTLEKNLGPIADLDPAIVVDFLLAYRAAGAWQEMMDLVSKMSPALQATVTVREQLALAQIRSGRADDTEETLKLLLSTSGTSSAALAIQGHLYKFRWEELRKSADKELKLKWLTKAINAYSESFRIDPRDPHPGMNAVILLEVRGDLKKWPLLLPVVRFALDQMKGALPKSWLPALLEFAVVQSDRVAAARHVGDFMVAEFAKSQSESTAQILRLIREGRASRGESMPWVAAIENQLHGGTAPPPTRNPATDEARELAALVDKYTEYLKEVPEPNRRMICRALLSGDIAEAARLIRQDLKVPFEKSKEIAQDILKWRGRNAAL